MGETDNDRLAETVSDRVQSIKGGCCLSEPFLGSWGEGGHCDPWSNLSLPVSSLDVLFYNYNVLILIIKNHLLNVKSQGFFFLNKNVLGTLGVH